MAKTNKAGVKETGNKKVEGKKGASKVESIPIKNIAELKRIYDMPDENITPMMILHKMSEVLEFYLKNIQQILQPEEFHALYECNAFSDADKLKLFDLYKRIIITHREILKAEITNDEKDSLSTIQFVHEEIKAVKPEMLEIVKKMQQSWKTDNREDARKGTKQYFG